jgi:phosphatidylserine decarboxylase
METNSFNLPPIHKEGHKFILIFAAITFLFFILDWAPLGWVGVILTLWCAYFFRDPDRTTPIKEGLIISPADGVVQFINESVPPAELDMGDELCTRVVVFMNVFDVHVNRIPIDGKIIKQAYVPGKFLDASVEKASVLNERHAYLIEAKSGKQYAFVQVAGLVARRIVSWADDGQEFKAGERFGLIRFGSRLDVYLPKGVNPAVCVGQRAIAGETILADEKSKLKAREGEIR